MNDNIVIKHNIVTQLQILSSYNDFFKDKKGIIYKMASSHRRKRAYIEAKLLDGEISDLLKMDLDNNSIDNIKKKLGVRNDYKKDFSSMSLDRIEQSINNKENEFDRIRYDLKIVSNKLDKDICKILDDMAMYLSILQQLDSFMSMYGDYNPLKVDVLLEIRDKLLLALGSYVTYSKGVGLIDEVEYKLIYAFYMECNIRELKLSLGLDFSSYLTRIKNSIINSIYVEANK